MAIPEVVFDQINGPRLVILNADGVSTSSLFINSQGHLDVISSGGLSGSNTTDVQSAVSSSYISASYGIIGTFTASFISASVISASALYTNIFTAAISTMSVGYLTVTQVINGTSSWALNTKTASYIAGANVDAFTGTHDGNQVGNIIYNDHFLATTGVGDTGWTNTISSGVVSVLTAENDKPGIVTISTGVVATGRASLHKNITGIRFGNGTYRLETLVRVPITSSAAERYVLRIGFGDNTGAGDNVDGAYFEYTDTASPNWMIKTSNASTRTTQTSSIALTANTWQKLGIIVQDTKSASFYINDVQAGTTIGTNIASGSANVTGILNKIEKSVGTTARLAHIDYSKLAYY